MVAKMYNTGNGNSDKRYKKNIPMYEKPFRIINLVS